MLKNDLRILFFVFSAPVGECKPETRNPRGPGERPAPLLRSRTLPAIVAPGLNILQAQIDARYNSKFLTLYTNSAIKLFNVPLITKLYIVEKATSSI